LSHGRFKTNEAQPPKAMEVWERGRPVKEGEEWDAYMQVTPLLCPTALQWL
jgi:hypothetical protein